MAQRRTRLGEHAAIIVKAAEREVSRRRAQGWVIARGVTQPDLVNQLAAELARLRTTQARSNMIGLPPLEPIESWLAHAPYEALVNEFGDVFAPPRLRTATA